MLNIKLSLTQAQLLFDSLMDYRRSWNSEPYTQEFIDQKNSELHSLLAEINYELINYNKKVS
jgi:hypothetical protein